MSDYPTAGPAGPREKTNSHTEMCTCRKSNPGHAHTVLLGGESDALVLGGGLEELVWRSEKRGPVL